MFFSFLTEQEKENLIELAYIVAHSDNNLAEQEIAIIENLKKEANLNVYELQFKSFDKILEELDTCSIVSKASILLELLNIVVADADYNINEQKMIEKIREKWAISDEQFESIVFWLKDKGMILKEHS